MYNKQLETVPGAKEAYDKALKAASADRMKKVAIQAKANRAKRKEKKAIKSE